MVKLGTLFWQIPLTVMVCIIGSLIAAWAVSAALGLTMDPAFVVMLSTFLSAAAIAVELRARRTTK